MIRTVTALINELGKIRDGFSSTDIPISLDGRWINSIELVTDGKYEVVINIKGCMDDNSGLPHCPNCGSYNYEVGFHSSAHNCKCRDCGTLFFWNFNM